MGRRPVLYVLALAGVLTAASPATAKLGATTSLETDAGGTRIVASLFSTAKVPAAARPKGVSVKAGGHTYKLKRVAGAHSAKVALGDWRSAAFSGAAGTKLLALAGNQVSVLVRSRRSTMTLRSTLTAPIGPAPTVPGTPTQPTSPTSPTAPTTETPPSSGGSTGGGSGSPAPLFTPPTGELIGTDAFNYLSKWFLNSKFTDCPSGWPTCGVVSEAYTHCSDGRWGYDKWTFSPGSDTHAVDYFTITGAEVHLDGSWAVAYTLQQSGARYTWSVNTAGIATGTYAHESGAFDQLGPFQWVYPAAACG